MTYRFPLLFAALPLLGLACDQDDTGDPIAPFVAALPTRDTFDLEVPGEGEVDVGEAPLSIIEAPLIGAPSVLKQLTGTVRRYLGKLLDAALEDIDRLSEIAPVHRSAERVVWRIVTPNLGRERMLVMRREEGHFTLNMWVRDRDEGQAPGPWKFLLSGRFAPSGTGFGEGRGALWMNLDNDRKPRSHGKVAVLWSRIRGAREVELLVFEGTPDDGEVARLTRSYRYVEGSAGGYLAFDVGQLDVHLAPERSGPERVRVLTRWNAGHAMRADYSAVGPEVRADGYRLLIGSECWRPPEARIAFETRLGLPIGGGEAIALYERGDRASCAFAEEEPPIVATPGSPPNEPPPPEELDQP